MKDIEAKIRKIKKLKKPITNKQREEIIADYKHVVVIIARKTSMRLPANVEIDDLISAGIIGLMDAVDKFDIQRENKFKTYAEFRIRGAMMDELRSQDWVPRSMREKAKTIEKTYSKIEQQLGRSATDIEAAYNMGVELNILQKSVQRCRSVSLVSIDEAGRFSNGDKKSLLNILAAQDGYSPSFEMNKGQVKTELTKAINSLPEKQKLVLSLYYYEDMNLKEIGEILDVTESRVSQLHTQGVYKLRQKLNKQKYFYLG